MLGLPRRTQEEADARAKMRTAAATAIETAQATPKPPAAPSVADEVINPRQQRAAVAASRGARSAHTGRASMSMEQMLKELETLREEMTAMGLDADERAFELVA